MRSKKDCLAIIAIVVFLFGTIAFLFPKPAVCQEVIELKAANLHPATHRLNKDAYELWANEVNKLTKGKVKITWFSGGTLAKADQLYDAMISGLTDISVVPIYAFPHIFPLADLLTHPFMVDGSVHLSDTAWEMYQTIPEFKQEFSKIKVLGFFGTDTTNLALTKPPLVKTLADLKGRKIIGAAAASVETLRILGAAPQFQKSEDIYLSLQRGMADGVIFPNAPLRSFKIVELARYYTILKLGAGPFVAAMRLETWQKLPPDVQKVFNDTGLSFSRLCAHTLENEGLWVIEELKKRGDQFYEFSQQERETWRKATQPQYDRWIAKIKEKNINGQALLNKALAIAEKARKKPSPIDEWWKQGRMGMKIN
ncbi:MAG: TRAP transporter substrate-binding protein DctP [Deltaproteobacteria bacterium]|nr:TRAP transporter substrate-binding protein DctP [Deltaproteobacteria bacterium]